MLFFQGFLAQNDGFNYFILSECWFKPSAVNYFSSFQLMVTSIFYLFSFSLFQLFIPELPSLGNAAFKLLKVFKHT